MISGFVLPKRGGGEGLRKEVRGDESGLAHRVQPMVALVQKFGFTPLLG